VTGHETPAGTHFIWQKRISERMVADTVSDDPDFYNLPGVPFVCYFTDNWVATHGTYWHNDYGRPRSHGCVNMSPAAARWVWRWTTPHYPIDEFYHVVTNRLDGTRVVVRA
jgi:lipoprotein-anchoring transpeptidase ErfK/SrfK